MARYTSEWDDYLSDADTYCPDPHDVSLLLGFIVRAVNREKEEREAQHEAKKRASSRLCHRCSKVDFQPETLNRRGRYLKTYYLGTVKDVLARVDCPLCRLTVAAISEFRGGVYDGNSQCPFGVDPSEEVELEWDPNLGFTVNLAMPGCRISFVEDHRDEDTDDDDEDGRPLRRARILSESFFDTSLVPDWLSACQEHHGVACDPPIHDVVGIFRSSFLVA